MLRRFEGLRAVVTGAAGFVGSHLSEALIREGASVIGVDNMATGTHANIDRLTAAHPQRFWFQHWDVCKDPTPLTSADLIAHLASPASPKAYREHPIQTLRANSIGTERMLRLAVNSPHARLLFTSTSEVYGDPLIHPQPETYRGNVDPGGPRSMYDEGKRYGEAICAAYADQYRLPVAVARLFNIYGPRMAQDDGRAVPAFVSAALARGELLVHGDGQQTRSMTYVDDAVEALLLLLDDPPSGPVNVGSHEEVTVLDLAKRIIVLAGGGTIVHGPHAPDDPKRRRPMLDRIRQLTGWQPTTTLDDGLQRTIEAWQP